MTAEPMATCTPAKVVLETDAFPFKGLKISEDWQQLHSVSDRTLCSSCKKSRKYFCYTCYIPVAEIEHFVPKIKLPIKVDIIKHSREIDGKSTAVHAAVLAPEDVRIFTYPCIPDYDPSENVVLIFPNKDAVSVAEICKIFFRMVEEQDDQESASQPVARPTPTSCLVRRAVFIDSTWNQSRGIFKDPRIKALPSVVLRSRLSQFWRHQTDSPRWYLATVEAIHQFLVELDEAQSRLGWDTTTNSPSPSTSPSYRLQENSDEGIEKDIDSATVNHNGCRSTDYNYDGKYDNLLFFFRFMYSKIHTLYDHDQLRSYKRRLE